LFVHGIYLGGEDQEEPMAQTAVSIETSKQPTAPAPLKVVPPGDLLKRAEQLYDNIARRAFEIFEGNGRLFGRDLDNWFKAESELLHPVHIDITEAGNDLTVRAEVPGFTAKELEVSVEPRRVTISGKRETKEERKDKKVVYSESCSNRLLRVIDLPANVDADKASATLKDGILELRVPKAAPAKKVAITA
jgi:HSP20 family protein